MIRPLRCGVYIRKSRKDRDKEAHRLEVQREQLPAFASTQGWRPVVYDDGFASAVDQAKLPRLQDLIEQIRRREVDIVLCIELSRLSRDDSAVQYLQFLDLCRSHGVKLATPGQLLDPNDPSQWLILMMQGGISSVEMQQLKRRMAEGRNRAKQAGSYLGGPPPWPYRPVGNKQIAVTPEDKEKARLILQRLRHASVWEVSKEFPQLSPATLARMTTRSRLLSYAGKRELPDGTVVTCGWEPIITESEMHALRKASAGRLPYRRTGHEEPSRLLTGLRIFYCAYCDHTMKGHTDKKHLRRGDTVTYHYYRCNRFKVRAGQKTECKNQSLVGCHVIDEPLLLHVQHTLDRVEEIKEAFNRAVKNGDSRHDAPGLLKKLTAAERKRDRLVDSIAGGIITEVEARRALTQVREEIDALQGELANQAAPPVQLALLDEFQGINLAEYSLEEKRELLSIVVNKIELWFDRLHITYNLYESPGVLFMGRINVTRRLTHHSKLRQPA